jgi:hypothetical protein
MTHGTMSLQTPSPSAVFKQDEVEVELLCEKTYWGEPTVKIFFRDEEGFAFIWLTKNGYYLPEGSIKHDWMNALAGALQDPNFGTEVNRARSFLEENRRYL